jgi:hypothetical protein
MPTILAIAALFLLITDGLDIELSFLPGLSAKNLLIYLIAVAVGMRLIMGRESILTAGKIQAAFLIQFFYAVITMLVAALVIEYPGYDLREVAIKLKVQMLDYYVFFVVFLFGVRTPEEAIKVIKGLLLGAFIANAATVLDALGFVEMGFRIREDGRTGGAIGESNQYAAFILMFLPGTIAAAITSKGASRLFWLAAAMVNCFAMIMTASRGGFIGLAITMAVGAYLYRHLVSYSRVITWGLGGLVVLVVFLSLSPYGGLLAERMIVQTGQIDVGEASSGRSDIWLTLLAKMFEYPVSFITGFGWDVYWSMPFMFSPHNHYLSLWFNLGLVGLFTGIYLLAVVIRQARRASVHAQPPYRGHLIGFVLGGVGTAAAVFFVDLYAPWNYFWMYSALVTRIALCVMQSPATEPARVPAVRVPVIQRDPYGWQHSGGRS